MLYSYQRVARLSETEEMLLKNMHVVDYRYSEMKTGPCKLNRAKKCIGRNCSAKLENRQKLFKKIILILDNELKRLNLITH